MLLDEASLAVISFEAASMLVQVKSLIAGTLKNEKVDAQLITSGRGDWRFLDIVSKRAGKLAALE